MNLKCDILVSKFAFKWVILYRSNEVFAHVVSALVDGRIEFREDGVPCIVGQDGVRE